MRTNFPSTSGGAKLRTNFRSFGCETCREREMNSRTHFRVIGSWRTCTWPAQTTKMCGTHKFHTKPHNNHNTSNAAFNTKLVLHQQLATCMSCMHRKENHEGKRSSTCSFSFCVWLLWGFVWNFNYRLSHFVNFLLFRRGPWTRTQ